MIQTHRAYDYFLCLKISNKNLSFQQAQIMGTEWDASPEFWEGKQKFNKRALYQYVIINQFYW